MKKYYLIILIILLVLNNNCYSDMQKTEKAFFLLLSSPAEKDYPELCDKAIKLDPEGPFVDDALLLKGNYYLYYKKDHKKAKKEYL